MHWRQLGDAAVIGKLAISRETNIDGFYATSVRTVIYTSGG